MKLNGEIIHQKLKEVLKVALIGEPDPALSLERPEFYLEERNDFPDDHVFICSADHLPKRSRIGRNVLLICLGEAPELEAFKGRCTIIGVPESENIFEVFNLVQEVFNKFDRWEERINGILRSDADLTRMLEESREIFENPMLLIGADFNYLAHTEGDYLRERLGLRLEGPSFDADAMATFLSMHDLATDIKEPLLLRLMGRTTLSANIFDRDEFLGCVTVFGEFREIRRSDEELLVYLSHMLRQAIQKDPALAGEQAALRRAVRDVVLGRTVEPEHMRAISLANNKREYLLALFRPQEDLHPLPGGYVASVLESRFPNSMAFEIGGHVAALIPVESIAGSGNASAKVYSAQAASAQSSSAQGASAQGASEILAGLGEAFRMKCGVSQTFFNLYDARHAFAQASAAIRNGLQTQAACSVFFFEDHILDQLLANALGDTPARFFYPEGLKRLRQHDLSSQVSYIGTLKAYLSNNMSLTATAAELMLHRSSLIDRLARISQLLGSDLSDPDVRLTLQIILRAEELKPDD